MGEKPADIWYSTRLAEPFVGLIPPAPRADRRGSSRGQGSGSWVRVTPAHRSLEEAVAHTGDQTLGLKAGRGRRERDVGAIGYAMHTAATVGDALNVAARYIHVLNHALSIGIEREGSEVLLRLDSRVALPAVAEDFMLSAFHSAHLKPWFPASDALCCWFLHEAPASLDEYERTFAPARLRFSAPSSAFRFPADWLTIPLSKADPQLHAILIEYMERSLYEWPEAPTFTDKVRRAISERLSKSKVSAAEIAESLKVSERTLARKLAAEGTTFVAVLDDMRRMRAVDYLDNTQVHIEEIAFLLGFSHATAFYRAFKRWTGKTPQQYRASRYVQTRRESPNE